MKHQVLFYDIGMPAGQRGQATQQKGPWFAAWSIDHTGFVVPNEVALVLPYINCNLDTTVMKDKSNTPHSQVVISG